MQEDQQMNKAFFIDKLIRGALKDICFQHPCWCSLRTWNLVSLCCGCNLIATARPSNLPATPIFMMLFVDSFNYNIFTCDHVEILTLVSQTRTQTQTYSQSHKEWKITATNTHAFCFMTYLIMYVMHAHLHHSNKQVNEGGHVTYTLHDIPASQDLYPIPVHAAWRGKSRRKDGGGREWRKIRIEQQKGNCWGEKCILKNIHKKQHLTNTDTDTETDIKITSIP